MSYAIISLGGKQYTVREGQRLLVDRLAHDEGKTFTPDVLLIGGDGETKLAPTGVTVTAKVLGPALGEKIRIGKYRPKSGYRRHTGFRAKLTQIEIESIGAGKAKAAAKPTAEPETERPKGMPSGYEELTVAQIKEAAAEPKAETAPERPKGMPSGYEELTVAQIKEAAGSWRKPQLEAALEFEQAGAARKGAIAAIEAALAEKEDS